MYYTNKSWRSKSGESDSMKKTLLIIEDAPEMIDLLRWRAQNHQFECMVDETGATWSAQIQNQKPDAVLLDMNLPLMGGFGILREFRNRKELSAIPIFVLSGISGEGIEEEALSLGATAYFHKDDDIDHILKKVSDRVNAA